MLALCPAMRTLGQPLSLLPAALAAAAALALGAACHVGDDPRDGQDEPFPRGKADGGLDEGSREALAVLALVNDPTVTFEELDEAARLHRTAAENIIAYRRGADGVPGTADDERYDTLAELDGVYWVGPYALEQLLAYAIDQGYLPAERSIDVVFSPQPYAESHNVRVAELIDAAEHTLDIAMYSYSDGGIADALERAVARGVRVRFLFETASDDRRESGSALDNTKSARLERLGIDVRWVNKIMHHKLMIMDGPRDHGERADTATIVTGSGNWSWGAATRYDENTLFFTGHRELTLRIQAEFNHLWNHSRDFVYDESLPFETSGYVITDDTIADAPETHAYFTSDNFDVTGDTFRINWNNTVSDQLVAAIEGATESIYVASGHLRSRPVAEALIARAAADPSLDIRVYLDGQEYISSWYHGQQEDELADCLAEASTDSQERRCKDKGFYFGYAVGQAGIDVRYKYYAYRWHYSYAEQMHHKYLVIDGDELWTGSYNLSDNAEHNTFENVLRFQGPEFAALIALYENNFASVWETGRSEGLYGDLLDEVETAAEIPLVFDSMALTWDEVTALKDAIYEACEQINSDPFRTRPEDHWSCPR